MQKVNYTQVVLMHISTVIHMVYVMIYTKADVGTSILLQYFTHTVLYTVCISHFERILFKM